MPRAGGPRPSITRDPVAWVAGALLAVLVGGLVVQSGTAAFFTFTAWVTGSTFQTGTVSLVASRTSSTELVVDRLLPGDILTRRLKVENPTSSAGGEIDAACGGAATVVAAASGTFTPSPRPAARCTAYFLSIVPKSTDGGTSTPAPTLLEHDVANGLHVAIFRCTSDEAGTAPVACPDGNVAGAAVYLTEVTGVTGGGSRVRTNGRGLGKSDMSVASGTLRVVPGPAVQAAASTASGTFGASPVSISGQPILTARNVRCNPQYFDYPTPPGLVGTPRFTRTPTTYTPTFTSTPTATRTATATATRTATPTATGTPTFTGTPVIEYDAAGRIVTWTPSTTPVPAPSLTPPPPGPWSTDAAGRIVTWTPTASPTIDPSQPTALPTAPLADACPMGGRRSGISANGMIVSAEGTTFAIPPGLAYDGLAPGDVDYLYLAVWLPAGAGNEFQERTQRYAVVLTAMQPAPAGVAAASTVTPFSTRTPTPTSASSPTRTATATATATATPTPDATAPQVQSIILAGGATPWAGPGATLAFTIAYAEPVTNVTAADFAVRKGLGVTGTPLIATPVIGVASTWKVTVNLNGATGNHGVDGNATISLDVVPGQTAQDGLGNKVQSAAVASGTAAYFLDTVAPTYALSYSPASPVKAGNLVVTATSNEALKPGTLPTVAIDRPGTSDLGATAMAPAAGTNTFSFTYLVNAANGGAYLDGSASVAISGADQAGNVGTTITGGGSFVIDTAAPSTPTGLALTPGTDTGTSSSDGITKVTSVSVTGSAEAGSAVALYDGVIAISGATGVASGGTFNIPTTLATGSHSITAKATDAAGNQGQASSVLTVVVDQVAPVVNAVTTSTAAGSYKAAGTVAIAVGFSEPVTSTGASSLLMETGSVDTAATCPAVNASATLSCTYVVAAGDTSSHLDYQSAGALTGTIADVAGNAATLALPTLGTSGVYSGQVIVIDTTAPAIAALSYSDGGAANPTGPYKAGDAVTVTATFIEAVALAGAPTLSLVANGYDGATLPAVSLSGSGVSYTGSFTIPGGNGAVTATVGATDTAGNVLAAAGQAGFTVDNLAPTGTFASLVAGDEHNCALTPGGAAWCWGRNQFGQLGDGTTNDRPTPVAEASGRAFTSLSAGAKHTCGLSSGRAAWCWGENYFGQLGNGTTATSSAPVAVSGGKAFTSLAAGYNHTCGLEYASGMAWCWGSSQFGQLGNGTLVASTSPTAVAMPAGVSFSRLDTGQHHTCGLATGGAAWCWGWNDAGQLGDGTTTNRSAPVAVSSGPTFASLAAGAHHTCGLAPGGSAWCWGSGGHGRLGDGTETTRLAPVIVSGNKTFASLAAGGIHSCGVAPGGGAWCWGGNISGQLGDGTTTGRVAPVAVGGGQSFTGIVAGIDHTCGLTAGGGTSCWGSNAYGQLGEGAASYQVALAAVSGNGTYTSVVGGSRHTCGLTSGGAAQCWGANENGQLGDGTKTSRTTPVAVSGGLTFTSLVAGDNFTCGLASGGAAWCWGYGGQGQLGNGTTSAIVPVPVSGGKTFTSLAAGQAHVCGVVSGGAAWCWGFNLSSQLADGTTVTRMTPVAAAVGLTFTSLAAGRYGTCGLVASGAAWCWGYGATGTLGNGVFGDSTAPVAVSGGLTLTNLVAGDRHVCGLVSDGTARCWGYNWAGQVGDGTTTNRNVPVAVSGGQAFTSLRAGWDHTCALTSGGAAWCWGNNQLGQLGDATTISRSTPVAVSGGLAFTSLGAGDKHTCGVASGGTARCWGWGGWGQLGDGAIVRRTAPVAISNPVQVVGLAYTDGGVANQSGPYKVGDNVTVTATFTEANAISGTPTLTLVANGYSGGTLPTFALALSSGTTYVGNFTVPDGNGAVTATVGATDTAGNVVAATGQAGFTIDNVAPTHAITYSRPSPLSAGAVTITVTASEALASAPTISIAQPGSTDITSAATGGAGPYTYAYTVVAANASTYVDGTATVTVSGTDPAGNVGTAVTSGGTFDIDTTAPAAPTGLTLTTATDTGTSTSDGITNQTSVSVTGSAEAGSTVALLDGGNAISGATGSASGGTFTIATTLATGNHSITAKATDAAGNVGGASDVLAVTVDQVAPTVTGVTSALANGSYKAAQLVPVTVTFAEPVTVTGTPQLTLSTGTPATTAVDYASGSGTTVLTFNYVVASGNESADLDYVDTSALGLNGGTVRDAAGNGATLTLASPGAQNSLGLAKAIVIDTTAPTVASIMRAGSAGALTNAAPVFTVTFSEGVSGVAGANFAASKGSATVGTASIGVSGSGTTWAATVSGLTGDWGTNANATVGLTVVPAGAAVTDAAGNALASASVSGTTESYNLDNSGPAGPFTSLAAGWDFTCGLDAVGAAWCWGRNLNGQIGDGTTTNRSAPVAVSGGQAFTSLAAGVSHACGLTSGGAAWCWGLNSYGQLGDGTQVNRLAPVAVLGGRTFAGLAAGESHTCGLEVGGAAWCWGWNVFGQLGDGTTTNRSAPVAVSGGRTFASFVAGYYHACGREYGGAAWCWGGNAFGQVGDGTTTDRYAPVAVSGGRAFASFAAGHGHICGLEAGGAAWCWGYNDEGQLGDGTTTNRYAPVAVAGGRTFTSLAAGQRHACGLATGGAVWCWGRNDFGQLGDGTTTNRYAPAAVSGGQSFTFLAAGVFHTCGLASGGAAWCWGGNLNGQLGDGTTTNRSAPVTVDSVAPTYAITYSRPSPFKAGAVTLTITASEPLASPPTISIAQPGSTDINAVVTSGSGQTYTYAYTVVAANATTYVDGAATITVSGTDVAGNVGTSVTSGATFVIDTTTPAIAALAWSDGGAANPAGPYKSGDVVTVTATFTEAVALAGTPTLSLVANGYSGGTLPAVSLSGSGLAYSASITIPGGNGAVTATVGATDTAGNALAAAGQAGFTIDNLAPTGAFTSLVAGDHHTCVLASVGSVARCWGGNQFGQLGDGTTTDRPAPVAVSGGRAFASLVAGGKHTCGLEASGAAWCWGDGYHGQLGTGGNASASAPVAVSGGLTFTRLAAGLDHTCGLVADGTARCWGGNWYGQLGNGDTASRNAPFAVSGSHAFTGLAAGWEHTCGVTTSGGVRCWGANGSGQLGDGTGANQSVTVAVSGGETFGSLVAGQAHTCGLTTAGAARCWGSNWAGQLGNGPTGNQVTPVAVSGGLTFASLAAGGAHTCGVAPGGAASCWGWNYSGQLGGGAGNNWSTPVAVGGGQSFIGLEAGLEHTCGLAAGGGVSCWGANYHGQLGEGTASYQAAPVAVAGGQTFTGVVAGSRHACGLVSGAPWCWGWGYYSQMGDGTYTSRTTPVAVSVQGGLTFTSLVAGVDFTCGLTIQTSLGNAWCWGYNGNGQLGDASNAGRTVPVRVSGGHVFTSLAAGLDHACGLKDVASGGNAWCWGSNAASPWGAGTTTDQNAPKVVPGDITFTSLAAGLYHTCGLTGATSGGNAWCWGGNSTGQLGRGIGNFDPSTTPVAVSGGLTFTSLAAGQYHTCGLVSGGTARCWGYNWAGQLGDNTTANQPAPVTVVVSGGLTFASLRAGWDHTCAVASGGAAWCWGFNGQGQLGDATTTSRSTPVAVSGGLAFTSLGAGNKHTCGVATGGGASCWGWSGWGQLGNGVITNRSAAAAVSNPVPVVALAYTDGGVANQSGPYKVGDQVTVTATFTEANAISGTPTLTLVANGYSGGDLPSVALALSSGTTYTGTFTVPAGNGAVTATVGATDTAGNLVAAAGQVGFIVDNVAPTVGVVQELVTTETSATWNAPRYTVAPSDENGIASVTLEDAASANGAFSTFGSPVTTPSSGNTYVVPGPTISGTRWVRVRVVDLAGNEAISSALQVTTWATDASDPGWVLKGNAAITNNGWLRLTGDTAYTVGGAYLSALVPATGTLTTGIQLEVVGAADGICVALFSDTSAFLPANVDRSGGYLGCIGMPVNFLVGIEEFETDSIKIRSSSETSLDRPESDVEILAPLLANNASDVRVTIVAKTSGGSTLIEVWAQVGANASPTLRASRTMAGTLPAGGTYVGITGATGGVSAEHKVRRITIVGS